MRTYLAPIACLLLLACGAEPLSDLVPPPSPALSDGAVAASDGASPSDLSPPPGDMGPGGDLLCVPAKVSCGKCGTQQIACVDGQHVGGACEQERECMPGDKMDHPGGCYVHTCGGDCRWSLGLKSGNTCSTGSVRTCAANPGMCPSATGVQRCIACKWSACMCS